MNTHLMILKLLAIHVLILMIFESISYSVDCNTVLSTANDNALTTELNTDAESSKVSDAAEAYLRLIEYGLGKTENRREILEALSATLTSNSPVNPFFGANDILTTMVSAKIETLIPELFQDWGMLRGRLQGLLQKLEGHEYTRTQNQNETNTVVVPRLIQELKTGGKVRSNPAWQMVGERLFLAVGADDHHLYLYEYNRKSGLLEERGKYETASSPAHPVWQVLQDRVFLAVDVNFQGTYLYELDKKLGILQRRGMSPTSTFDTTPAWFVANDRIFLATGSRDARLYQYELDLKSGQLVQLKSYEANSWMQSPVWQVVGDRVFLAAGSADQNIYLFELNKDGLLEFRGKHLLSNNISSSPSWFFIRNQVYLAVGSNGPEPYLFKLNLKKSKLQKVSFPSNDPTSDIHTNPVWQVIGERVFLLFGAENRKLYLYELDPKADRLNFVSATQTESGFNSVPVWVNIKGGNLVVVGSDSESVHVYDLNSNYSFSEIWEYKTNEKIHSSPAWQQIDDRDLIAVGSTDKSLYVFQLNTMINKK